MILKLKIQFLDNNEIKYVLDPGCEGGQSIERKFGQFNF